MRMWVRSEDGGAGRIDRHAEAVGGIMMFARPDHAGNQAMQAFNARALRARCDGRTHSGAPGRWWIRPSRGSM